ncbi:MAG: SRPBCC domain-containing protein [Saprospiraceae bacterium]
MNLPEQIHKEIHIQATRWQVWKVLTDPVLMVEWMGDPAMHLSVEADWRVGGRILIRGHHHTWFENNGNVVVFQPPFRLIYNQLNTLSRLPGLPENYTSLDFQIFSESTESRMSLTIRNFPTDSIYRHYDFYWQGTLQYLVRLAEGLV